MSETNDKKYWVSIEDFENSRAGEVPGRLGNLPRQDRALEREGETGLSRRDFLKFSAATMALISAGCALRPAEKLVPYVKSPEEIVPGIADYYATTLGDAAGTGVLVKTREGRPIKIEGNPSHPLSQGKLDARGQAAIFSLYDPDRLKQPVKRTPAGKLETVSWQQADGEIAKSLLAATGKVALLTGTMHGPARMKLVNDFCSAFGATHVMCDAFSTEVTRQAQEKCYGQSVLPRYRFDRAEYVLVLDADPLGHGFSQLEWATDFGKLRKLRANEYSKLVVFESAMTLTGANADERFRVKPQDVERITLSVARQLLVIQGQLPKGTSKRDFAALAPYLPTIIEKECGLPTGTIVKIAKALWDNMEMGLVVAGENPTLQILANLLNSACGNDGRTIDGTMSPSRQSRGGHADLFELIADMKSGKIDVLLVHGTNPAYFLPEEAGFAEGLRHVKTIVSLDARVNETAAQAHYVLPSLHWLENWGDAEPQAGLYSLMQPTIYPIHDNRAAENSLIAFAKTASAGGLASFAGGWHEYVMNVWEKEVYSSSRYAGSFEEFWNGALREGVVNTVIETGGEPRPFNLSALDGIKTSQKSAPDMELVLLPSPIMGDGRDANNPWLLECPDPVTRIAWTNVARLSPATAQKLGIEDRDVVRLESHGIFAELPAHVQPGDADGVVSIQTGWGHTRAGEMANGAGINAFAFRRVEGDRLRSSGLECKLSPTGTRLDHMPTFQGQDYTLGRPVIGEATLAEFVKNHEAGKPKVEVPPTMWPKHSYPGYRWGMRIDLSSCIACHACVVACKIENNVPIVGRDQTMRGRYMDWIRIDRYYSGSTDNPDVTFQPMLCQQCENAPCETVCPVIAAVHNEEGLNQQVYNRCVGTRYCSNNCPYKVRRFNWYEFALKLYKTEPRKLGLNPDVTVREKGVMEKCTYCWQRIKRAELEAKQLGRTVTDADLQTACQQTCPTNAIVFGDMNNPQSEISKARKDERSYFALEVLNTQPSAVYWTKLRNRGRRET